MTTDHAAAARYMYRMGARHMLLDAGLVETLEAADTDPRLLKLMADYDRSNAELDARLAAEVSQ